MAFRQSPKNKFKNLLARIDYPQKNNYLDKLAQKKVIKLKNNPEAATMISGYLELLNYHQDAQDAETETFVHQQLIELSKVSIEANAKPQKNLKYPLGFMENNPIAAHDKHAFQISNSTNMSSIEFNYYQHLMTSPMDGQLPFSELNVLGIKYQENKLSHLFHFNNQHANSETILNLIRFKNYHDYQFFDPKISYQFDSSFSSIHSLNLSGGAGFGRTWKKSQFTSLIMLDYMFKNQTKIYFLRADLSIVKPNRYGTLEIHVNPDCTHFCFFDLNHSFFLDKNNLLQMKYKNNNLELSYLHYF